MSLNKLENCNVGLDFEIGGVIRKSMLPTGLPHLRFLLQAYCYQVVTWNHKDELEGHFFLAKSGMVTVKL